MKLSIKTFIFFSLLFIFPSMTFSEDLRERTLRNAAKKNGILPAEATKVPYNPSLVPVGKLLFESKLLSPDNSISCATCHVDQFGSADGIPNAVGVGGKGIGLSRLRGDGRIVPRNTLPLWARGEKGFDVLFWDGKVDARSEPFISQFGDERPSDDPLVVAIHLPPVELSEMVADIDDLEKLQTEEVVSAQYLYNEAVKRIVSDERLNQALTAATGKRSEKILFSDIAEALAAFIRDNFGLAKTKFHSFVFDGGTLSKEEISGGLIFYGKGNCAVCHNGPYFSNFEFHSIPSPSFGFGKNGFGVDYGRYNVTLNPADIGKYRTPPLLNVSKTAPYMHSGSISNLVDTIITHHDPLLIFSKNYQSTPQRMNFYDQLRNWASEPVSRYTLLKDEIEHLTIFLETLRYDSKYRVVSD